MDDPVYVDWKRRYPKFPGVPKCIDLLGHRNTKGSLIDILCAELGENAGAHAEELIAAVRATNDDRLRGLLLSVLCEARLFEAFPVFVEHLSSVDELVKYWAIWGLRNLGTREARQALWDAGVTVSSHRRHR